MRNDDENKIGVFISYNSDDREIADELKVCLASISNDLRCFIDHSGIAGGDFIDNKLSEAISNSTWFILIQSGPPHSDKDMSWCLYEAGQFRQKLGSNQGTKEALRRLVVLYDEELPRQLRPLKGFKVGNIDRNWKEFLSNKTNVSLLEHTELFDFFEDIIRFSSIAPLKDLGDESTRTTLRDHVKRLTAAFEACGQDIRVDERPLYPRISFDLLPTRILNHHLWMKILPSKGLKVH